MRKEMKDSGIPWIGEIPSHWEIQRLQTQLYELNEKNTPIKTDFVLSLTNSRGVIPYTEKGDVGNKAKENHEEYKIAYPNTIVANSMNILIGSVGICNYYGCVSPVYYILKERSGTDLRFYNYVLSCVPFQKHLRQYANGILEIRLRLSCKDILQRRVPTPSYLEQQSIADFLDKKCGEIDEMVSLQEKIIEELKAYKQSLISEITCKGLDHNASMKDSGFDWLGVIPSHWTVIKNRFLFKENVRPCVGDETPLSLSQADGLIATDDMKEQALKTSTYEGWKAVKLNDIVLNRFKAHLGVLFCAKLEGMVSFHYGVYEAQRKLVPKYFEYLYHSNSYRHIYSIKSNGMVVGLQNLSNSNFYSVDCLFPPVEEQRAIADYLDTKCAEIDALVSLKQSKIEALKEYKKSIIYEYITGKKGING